MMPGATRWPRGLLGRRNDDGKEKKTFGQVAIGWRDRDSFEVHQLSSKQLRAAPEWNR